MIMRVTTQMINRTAQEAGLPIRGASLLDYLENDSADLFLPGSISKSSASHTVNSTRKAGYEKLEEAADQLLQQAELFTKEGEESVFEKARKSGNAQELYDEVENYVKKLNDVIKNLKGSSDPLSALYFQSLQEVLAEKSEPLEKAGVTVSKDGTITLDKDKLKETDIDSLEKLFGASGTLSAKVSILATKISGYAQGGIESLFSQYTSTGDSYAALMGKYDFWG